MAKKKISGRVVHALPPRISQIYWTCPTRKCKEIHYFEYVPHVSSGSNPIYKKACDSCGNRYIAIQINVNHTLAILVATFEEEEDAPSSG